MNDLLKSKYLKRATYMLRVPWLPQRKNYTCVPVCIRILLLYDGICLPLWKLVNLLYTTPQNGTRITKKKLGRIFSKAGRRFVYAGKVPDIEILRGLLEQKRPFMAGIKIIPTLVHTVVVIHISPKNFFYIDPAARNGRPCRMRIEKFLKLWKGAGGDFLYLIKD